MPNDPIHAAAEAAWDKAATQAPVETPVPEASPAVESPPETPVDAKPEPPEDKPLKAAEQPRKDDGKFDKKPKDSKETPIKDAKPETKPAEQAKPVGVPKPEEKPAPKVEAPKHWKIQDREEFLAAPPKTQQWILRREQERERDYTQRVQALQPHAKLAETAGKWAGYLQQIGADGPTAFNALLTAEARLRMGTPAEKQAALQKLAKDYGIPLEQAAQPVEQQYVDPQVQSLQQVVARQNQTLAQLTQQQQMAQRAAQERMQQSIVNQISSFADERDANGNPVHPFFEDVADDMAILVQAERAAGRSPDLKTLYDKAVWSNQALRQRILDEQREAAVERAKQAAQTRVANAQQAAVSVSGSPSGTGNSPPRHKNVSEAVNWAWEQASRA